MTTLASNLKIASGSYKTGVTLTSAGNNPFTFGGIVSSHNTSGGASYIGLYLAPSINWSVTNTGSITGGRYGVANHGTGTVTNSADIHGTAGIDMYQAATVVNSGTVVGDQVAVSLKAGGLVTNTGFIGGQYSVGLQPRSGGAVNNNDGIIAGKQTGILLSGKAGQVSNSYTGLIKQFGSSANSTYAGVALHSGGTVTNLGSKVSTQTAVSIDGAAGTVTNAGILQGGGYAVRFGGGFANRLLIEPGGIFIGKVNGGDTIGAATASTIELSPGRGTSRTGTLSGIGSQYVGFANLTVDNGASWVLGSTNYNASPQTATLTNVASATGTPGFVGGFYAAQYFHNLGYSDPNVWTIMASRWGADANSAFNALYASFGTNYSGFISAVYTREFGFAPSASALRTLVGDVPGVQQLLGGGNGAATPIQVVSGIYGYLLWVGQTTPTLPSRYATSAEQFLLAAANGTVSYGPELTQAFPANANWANGVSATAHAASAAADPGIITISAAAQLVDPGQGSHTIQFMAGAGGDTLVLHTSGTDVVSGFNPASDVLDVRSLLLESGVVLTGDTPAYFSVADQGANAVLAFDPSGHGGGSAIAVPQGLGGTVTGLNSLLAEGALRIS